MTFRTGDSSRKIVMIAFLIGLSLACTRTGEAGPFPDSSNFPFATATPASLGSSQGTDPSPFAPLGDPTEAQPASFPTPTLDPTRPILEPTLSPGVYFVQPGDTIGGIAQRFGVTQDSLIAANNLVNPNALEVGQNLIIPVSESEQPGPNFKIIPDSELVYSPAAANFNAAEYIRGKNGYLNSYTETVEGLYRTGPDIVDYVAWHYSVNPRLLLAVLEYRSNWVTNTQPSDSTLDYPIFPIAGKNLLYHQLAWAADQMNAGYYLWKAGAISFLTLTDGTTVRIGPGVNAGTVGVQFLLAQILGNGDWQAAVSNGGFDATYQSMFGYPFAGAVEPLIPPGLTQPDLILPFEKGVMWYFTGGPHGGWGEGSAYAAIDFGPGDVDSGCVQSEDWEVASAPGIVVRSEEGAVVLDLDMDGNEYTGWTLLYMHLEDRDRVPLGTRLQTGDRIGHPGCVGGVTSGTHLHFARRYNGEWIPADGPIPFVLDGWTANGTGTEYDGYLTKGDTSIEAKGWSADDNIIFR